jgi:Flp pilus assembly protein TadD
LTKAVQASPDNVAAGVLKAAVHVELREFDKAADLVDKLREEHGERPEILTVLGDLEMARGGFEAAVTAYRRVYELAPVVEPMRTLFRAQAAAGRTDEASALMESWLASHPNDLGSLHLYAQLLMGAKNWARAKKAYEDLQAQGVEDVVMLNNLAVCYQQLGDARALPTAELAYKMAPADANVADTYGWILLEQGRLEEGLALLREAYARSSTSPAIRYHIGLALARLGRTAEAREEVEAALAEAGQFSARADATDLLRELRARGGQDSGASAPGVGR